MARRLGAAENNLILQDNLSGSELKLIYRMPTTKETSAYANGMVQRKGNKITRQLGEMRQKFGAKILIGVGDGSYEKQGEDGQWRPLSSNPQSADYDADWKSFIRQHAPDNIEALAIHVFETSVQIMEQDEDDTQDGEPAGKL